MRPKEPIVGFNGSSPSGAHSLILFARKQKIKIFAINACGRASYSLGINPTYTKPHCNEVEVVKP